MTNLFADGPSSLLFSSPLADLAVSAPQPALVVAQVAKWFPTWVTPIWVIGAGLVLGALVCVAVYGVLAILSLIPGLGTLPDSPGRGIIASLVVGGGIAAFLCTQYVPQQQSYAESLYLPLIVIGLVIGFGLIYGMWHRTRAEWGAILSEGIVPYLLAVAGIFAVIALVATPWVKDPMAFIDSIPAVNLVGDGTRVEIVLVPASPDVDPDAAPFHPTNLDYNTRTVSELTIESDRTVLLGDAPDPAGFSRSPTRVNPGEQLRYRLQDRDVPPIPANPERLHIQNREIDDAVVKFTFKILPPVPQASVLVGMAVFFFFLITSIVAFRQAAPRVWALALSTAKNEMAQMLYLLLLVLGIVGVLIFSIYPFNTLGDDIRMFKDSGVTLIMVLGMIQAVWSAGTSVSEEIEGRTALTVLSKPVSRRSFILGKYVGIMMAVLVLFVIISAFFLLLMSYKPIYDARETTRAVTTWQQGLSSRRCRSWACISWRRW